MRDGDNTRPSFRHSSPLIPAAAVSESPASSSGPHRKQMQTTHGLLSCIQNTSWRRWHSRMRRVKETKKRALCFPGTLVGGPERGHCRVSCAHRPQGQKALLANPFRVRPRLANGNIHEEWACSAGLVDGWLTTHPAGRSRGLHDNDSWISCAC